MLILCFYAGDFSPILPLSASDLQLLTLLAETKEKEKKRLYLLLADIEYFLSRLSGAFTGIDKLSSELPSELDKMTDRYMRSQRDVN